MPTVLQIMGAGRKPIHELAIAALAGRDLAALGGRPTLRTLEVAAPPSARRRIVIEGEDGTVKAAELLRRLGADGDVKL
jgi:electron transfer flavoprotein alpha/beta subunit